MIPLVAAREMRHAEDRAVRALGVSTLLLMENAGRGAAQAVERALGGVTGRRVAVVCGKGQNGGDGFVVARHLACRGAAVTCWLAGQAEEGDRWLRGIAPGDDGLPGGYAAAVLGVEQVDHGSRVAERARIRENDMKSVGGQLVADARQASTNGGRRARRL